MIAGGKRWITHASRSDVFRIWNMSDIHWMSRNCAEGLVRKHIKEIADDPYSFWLGGGDYVDCISASDKRWDPDAVAPWVKISDLGQLGRVGMRQIRDLFEPIKHKCLGLVIGNHELKYELHQEQTDLHAWLCTELGVPNLGYSAFLDLVFVRMTGAKQPKLQFETVKQLSHSETFRVFIHHGAGYAQTPGGKLNRLIQFMSTFDAEILFCGHVHDQVARKEPVLTADANCTSIVQKQRLGVISGSYLKTYEQGTRPSYGEQRGYRPTSLGAAIVEITPDKREMRAAV